MLPAAAVLAVAGNCGHASELPPIAPVPRTLPPAGIALPEGERERLSGLVRALEARIPQAGDRRREAAPWADAAVMVKAVGLALENGEFYKPTDLEKANALLAEGSRRIGSLEAGRAPWLTQTGLVMRGFFSRIDDSPQPVGIEVPEQPQAPADGTGGRSCYVWLHGRDDSGTDLHFIHERMTRKGQFQNAHGIVVHPFGRHCLGFKSAGETDVLEAVDFALHAYAIDRGRVALMGFSMGGAGAWHLGAHFADRWSVVHAGAGFVDVRRYQRLDPATRPPWEVKLWGQYDVPDSRRNFLNVPLIVYSGELDKQKASADIMEEELKADGFELRRAIGAGAGHRYTPEALSEVRRFVDAALAGSREPAPPTIHWQTRTLRYPGFRRLTLTGLIKHWEDSRVDLRQDAHLLNLTTRNVRSLTCGPMNIDASPGNRAGYPAGYAVEVDGIRLATATAVPTIELIREGEQWRFGREETPLRKRPGLQGPIDDAFSGRFLVVVPSRPCQHPRVERWLRFELSRFEKRWREVFRGRLRMKKDSEVTPDDLRGNHVILWGEHSNNRLIADAAPKLPIRLGTETHRVGGREFPADRHIVSMIYPKAGVGAAWAGAAGGDDGYLVINSGPTFREAHDRTNSQQNPKLPDWAVVDLLADPDAAQAGAIAAAGFFDESWALPAGD